MRCPTCGETLDAGQERCSTCGASVGRRLPSTSSHPGSTPVGVKRCPRCGYTGQGITYFSKPGHIGLLVGVSFFTYGMGGLVYWLARRKHRICPSCGLGWESASRVLAAGQGGREVERAGADEERLPRTGTKRRVLGAVLILFATFLILMGVVEAEIAAVLVGSVIGAGGSGTFYWGWKAQQGRRQALMGRLQRRVLRLATVKGGTLTVTDVAADLNVSMEAAERVLIAMDDGFRVRSEITDEGILLYEFPEVQHRRRLDPGG